MGKENENNEAVLPARVFLHYGGSVILAGKGHGLYRKLRSGQCSFPVQTMIGASPGLYYGKYFKNMSQLLEFITETI